jgi:hypothetical protein
MSATERHIYVYLVYIWVNPLAQARLMVLQRLFLFFNQGITPWLTCKTSPEGLEMAFNFPCPVSAAAS